MLFLRRSTPAPGAMRTRHLFYTTAKPVSVSAGLTPKRPTNTAYSSGQSQQQPPGPDGARLIATDWIASNCTSNWNGQTFRIDSLAVDGRP